MRTGVHYNQSFSLQKPLLLPLLYNFFVARAEFVFHRSTLQEVGAPALGEGEVQGASLHVGDSQVDLNLSEILLNNESFD